MTQWRCVLELDPQRRILSGSADALREAIGRGADLRIGTEFRHNEHIDVSSPSPELIREVAEFGVTYLLDGRWAAGVMTLRQPIDLPQGFGPRPSMSFFLYNQDGMQAIARPFLDGKPAMASCGPSSPSPPAGMPRYRVLDQWDEGTNAPSQNFVYDFDHYRYCVHDCWHEVYSHSKLGEVMTGSLDDLTEAFRAGCEIKLAIRDLCHDLAPGDESPPTHELFVQGGSAYFYTEQQLFMIGTHPVVRVAPQVPMRYASGNWDFGWLMVRTDGRVVYRRCDPYSLKFSDHVTQNAVRWFVR